MAIRRNVRRLLLLLCTGASLLAGAHPAVPAALPPVEHAVGTVVSTVRADGVRSGCESAGVPLFHSSTVHSPSTRTVGDNGRCVRNGMERVASCAPAAVRIAELW